MEAEERNNCQRKNEDFQGNGVASTREISVK